MKTYRVNKTNNTVFLEKKWFFFWKRIPCAAFENTTAALTFIRSLFKPGSGETIRLISGRENDEKTIS